MTKRRSITKQEKTDHGDHSEETRHAYRKPSEYGSFSSSSSSDTGRLQLFRQCRIPKLLSVQIHKRDMNAMFDFTFTEFMQVRLPVRVFL